MANIKHFSGNSVEKHKIMRGSVDCAPHTGLLPPDPGRMEGVWGTSAEQMLLLLFLQLIFRCHLSLLSQPIVTEMCDVLECSSQPCRNLNL